MTVVTVLTIVLLVIAWIFIAFGMVSVFKIKNLYTRILSAATIDTVGSLTILIALLISSFIARDEAGWHFQYDYVIRFVLLIGFLLITTPISSHVNIRSAYLTGVEVKELPHREDKEAAEAKEETYNA